MWASPLDLMNLANTPPRFLDFRYIMAYVQVFRREFPNDAVRGSCVIRRTRNSKVNVYLCGLAHYFAVQN